MSQKQGKKFLSAAGQIEPRSYPLEEAVPLVQKIKFAKFDETVELHMRLGVDPKHADQMVRGTLVLPHGLGKVEDGPGDRIRRQDSRSHRGGRRFCRRRRMVTKIQTEGWTAFDAVIATPDMMRSVGKLGKVLGPRGLMPNPKTGPLPQDVAGAIRETKAGKIEFRVDKTGVIHVPVGKVSFGTPKLLDNAKPDSAVVKAKPAAAKGKYVRASRSAPPWGPASRSMLVRSTRSRLLSASGEYQ